MKLYKQTCYLFIRDEFTENRYHEIGGTVSCLIPPHTLELVTFCHYKHKTRAC